MSDEYGRVEWQRDSGAANAEAARRVELAIATGVEVLDFADLPAMTRLPEVLAEAQGVRKIYAGGFSPASEYKFYNRARALIDIAPLSGLIGLTSLDLSGTRITDATALSGLVRLTSLNLSSTGITDATALSGLLGLTWLDLSGAQITDATALSGLAGLTSLDLSYTRITDATALSGLVGLTSLDLSRTGITDAAALSGLVGLNWLNLEGTQVADLGFLLNLPEFAAERAKSLNYSNTPAAKSDRRLDLLSRLPSARCAVETVQYLKGTHPDFREPKGGAGVGRATLAARLEAASPVEVVVEGGLLQARNAGAPERLAPKELGTRIVALRGQVEAVLDEAKGKQMSEDIVKRFRRYARALEGEEVTYLLLDGPIAALRGGVNDPYITGALDGGFVEMWRTLVAMHDDLRPLLLPPEEDDLPELRDDVTAEEGIDLSEQAESALQEALEDGVVGASVVKAMQAATEYFKVAKVGAEKKHWLRRGAIAVGGVLVAIVGLPATLGAAAEGVMKVQTFLATPAGQALIATLKPLWEILKGLFV